MEGVLQAGVDRAAAEGMSVVYFWGRRRPNHPTPFLCPLDGVGVCPAKGDTFHPIGASGPLTVQGVWHEFRQLPDGRVVQLVTVEVV